MDSGKTEPAIGIDLGTTYSCVGVWRQEHRRVEILVNPQGNRTTPSWVAFSDRSGRLVGDPAVNQSRTNPTNTIYGAKRLIGRKFGDEQVQNYIKFCPFKVVPDAKDKPQIVITQNGVEKSFAPEQISSMVLAHMREIAEEFLKTSVKNAVITVPAYFNDAQRQATQDAATIAGLKVLRIINEPTAAAIAYGLDKMGASCGSGVMRKNVLVFDLGGGTFDVSLLVMGTDGVMKVKATSGDTYLGGEDFDNRMLDHFIQVFRRKHHKDLSSKPKALTRLKAACERAKRILSFEQETYIEMDCLHCGIDFHSILTRAKFEELNLELFTKCITTVDKCLKDAQMDRGRVDEVILVGGSTRIPKVQSLLQEYFSEKDLNKTINPDEAVAHGAAMLAAKMVGSGSLQVRGLILMDVTPLSLGISTMGDVMSVLIPRNSPIPTKVEQVYATVADYQTSVFIQVYEGERALVKDNNLLGEFELTGLPPLPSGEAKIIVCFEVDASSILTVSAKHLGSQNRKQITITNNRNRLSVEEISKMVAEAESFRAKDEERRQKALTKSKLENLIHNLQSRVRNNHPIVRQLVPAAKTKLERKIQQAGNWLDANEDAGVFEFHYWTSELERLWQEHAEPPFRTTGWGVNHYVHSGQSYSSDDDCGQVYDDDYYSE